MENGEKHNGEQNHDERLNVEEYQREEQVVATVFDEQKCKELLGELNSRQTLVKSKGRRGRIWQ